METTRRDFLTILGASALGTGAAAALAAEAEGAAPPALRTPGTKEVTTICPFCGVGCGQVVSVKDGRIVRIEGDPQHPVNEGAVCSKGAALYQVHHNARRLRKVRYRKPGARDWQDLSWDQAVKMIAERVKKTRDETWVGQRDGLTINHAAGIACLGGAALDTEECYLLSKAMRGLGVVWLEHQARI